MAERKDREKTQVGNAMNFRGFMYEPINEQGVVYLFGLIAEDLNMRVESIQQGYPDCTALRYRGNGRWERTRIEFEFKSSHFYHDINGCDMIVCWEDDLNKSERDKIIVAGKEILELKSIINTAEVPQREPKNPEDKVTEKVNLDYHFKSSNATKQTQDLFRKLDTEIKKINKDVWDKYLKSYIGYYSPDKLFLAVRIYKNGIWIDAFTNGEKLEGVRNFPNHENWGNVKIINEDNLKIILPSLYKSYEIMKKAEKEGTKTGWYAFTQKETEVAQELNGEVEE